MSGEVNKVCDKGEDGVLLEREQAVRCVRWNECVWEVLGEEILIHIPVHPKALAMNRGRHWDQTPLESGSEDVWVVLQTF